MGTIPQKLTTVPLDNESLLEEQVCQDISILNADWLLIGRQGRMRPNTAISLVVAVPGIHKRWIS